MSAININKNNFQNEIMDSEKTVLLDFWAPWCAPCRMVVPVIEEIAGERPDIKVGKINVDEQPELASKFSIMSIPTLVVMKNGKIVQQVSGARPKRRIASSFGTRACSSSTVSIPKGLPAMRGSRQNSSTAANVLSAVSTPRRCMRFRAAERARRSRSLYAAEGSPSCLPVWRHSHISSYSAGVISRNDDVRPPVNCDTSTSLCWSRSMLFALAIA